MALKVQVDSTHVESKPYTNRFNKQGFMHIQSAWLFLVDPAGVPDRFPTKIKLNIDDPASPYPVGTYVLHESQTKVDSYGNPEYSFPKLFPAVAAPVKQVA